MKGGTHSRLVSGFTIVEVMIVLVVTGAMLLSAMQLINGKQRVTSFSQSTHNLLVEMQQIVNEVASGYYPNNGSFSCAAGGATGLALSTTPAAQGTNQDCIFLGKVVQFGIQGTDPQQYYVYTLTGLRDAAGGALDLAAAKARVIAQAAGDTSPMPDVTETKYLQYGLTVSSAFTLKPAAIPAVKANAVAFVSNATSLGSDDGSQQVNVIPLTGLNLNENKANGAQDINATIASSPANPPGGVQICFNGGGTNQSALLSIGGSGRQGTFDLQIYSGQDCV